MILLFLSYFQQYAYYSIKVSFDDSMNILTGEEYIVYKNNSPNPLDTIYLNTYFNSMRKGSRYAEDMRRRGRKFSPSKKNEGWIRITEFYMEGEPAKTIIDTGDVSLVVLPEPILPGWVVKINLKFREKIPFLFSRMGHIDKHYEMAYWFPQISVYDSAGWHTDGYRGNGEFYNEFGDFDVVIDMPSGYVVMGTGRVVGDENYLNFLEKRMNGENMDSLPERWKVAFRAERVHNFVWVADKDYIIKKADAGSTDIYVLVLPGDEKQWEGMEEKTSRMVETYNRWYGRYDYPSLVVADGYVKAGGMEYPNIVIINRNIGKLPFISRLLLEDVIAHEVSHQWFFGMLGNNEMDQAWLDEAFASFTEDRYMNTYYPSDSLSGLQSYLMKYYKTGSEIMLYSLENQPYHEPIIGKKPYRMKNYYLLSYNRGKKVLEYIMSILGEDRFNMMMQDYFENCKLLHPSVNDFLRFVSWYGGEKVSRFVREYLFTEKTFDVSIEKINQVDNKSIYRIKRGWEYPVKIRIFENGSFRDTIINTWDLSLASEPSRIVVDPENTISETDEWNNSIPRNISVKLITDVPDVEKLTVALTPLIYKSGATWKFGIGGYTTQGGLRHNSLFYRIPLISGAQTYFSLSEPVGSRAGINLIYVNREYTGYKGFDLYYRFRSFFEKYGFNLGTRVLDRDNLEDYFIIEINFNGFLHIKGYDFSSGGMVKFGNQHSRYFAGYTGWIELNPLKWINLYIEKSRVFSSPPLNEYYYLEGNTYFPDTYNLILPFSGETTPLSERVSYGRGFTYYSGSGIHGESMEFFEVALNGGLLKIYGRMARLDGNLYREISIGLGSERFRFEIPLYPFEKNFYKRWVIRL